MKTELNFPLSYGDLKTTTLPLLAESTLQLFLQAKEELPREITVLDPIEPAKDCLTVYVSPTGSDNAVGDFDTPLLTLQEALNRVRSKSGARILLRGGTYTLKETVLIDKEHSGTDDTPLFISAYNGESVTLTAGKEIPVSAFMSIDNAVEKGVISSAMRGRLNTFSEGNSDHIVVADLHALDFDSDDIPPLSAQGPDYLIVNGKTQTLTRFPHKGLGVTMGKTVYNAGPCVATYSHLYTEHKNNPNPWMISYPEDAADHIRRWASYEDVWMYGALYQEWHRLYYKLNIDPVKETLSSDTPCSWGVCFAEKNTVYFYNVPEELTEPGEWYLDRKAGKLYLYPDTDLSRASVVLASKQHDLLEINGTKNVVLDGLTVMGGGGRGIHASDCDGFIIQNCRLGNFGSSAAVIEKSVHSGALYSSFTHTNQTMLTVQGRSSCPTEPDRNFIQNCLFFDPVIKYGLSFSSMGGVVSHNEIRDSLLCFNGSENVIEYNRLDGGAYNTSDSGPIYCSCLNIKFNNHIRYNYLYNMRKGVYGIYLDDLATGNFVYGNLIVYPFVDPPKSGRGVNIHSGKNNVVFNNVVFNAYQGATNSLNYYMHAGDHRWQPSLSGAIKSFSTLDEKLLDRRYPQIKAFLELLKINAKEREAEDFVRYINEDAARIPSGTVYTRNLFVNCKEPVSNHYLVEFCSYILNNYATDTADGLGFADPESGNFTLADDSPVFDLIPGFEATDFKKIGMIH